MAPVVALMVNPAVEEYVPPVVPVKVTDCGVALLVQNGVSAYEIVAAGNAVIVTDVVTGIAAQPPLAGIVYVTVYTPAVLVFGVMAPVVASIVNPSVEEKTPPAKVPLVPENVTVCTVALLEQNGEAYVITAVGAVVIVTLVVAVCKGHPLAAAIV